MTPSEGTEILRVVRRIGVRWDGEAPKSRGSPQGRENRLRIDAVTQVNGDRRGVTVGAGIHRT